MAVLLATQCPHRIVVLVAQHHQVHHSSNQSRPSNHHLRLLHAMAAQFSLIRGAQGAHALCQPSLSNAPCSAEVEERIEAAEMEKHAHGCLTDEASIEARDGATTNPNHYSGARSMIEERERELHNESCPQLEWALAQGRQDTTCSHDGGVCPAKQRARMIEQSEINKHAQGLLQDEASIKAVDMAKMREGKQATMVRQTENEKHAHGNLQDERAIMEADIPTALSAA